MEINLVKIGNSKGIRLNKMLLEKYNIQDKLELVLEEGYIILRPVPEPRKGWEQSFKEMHENKEDKLLIDDIFEDENWNE